METKLEQTKNISPNLIKVVLFGPESTYKSALAKALANHYNTVYVPEFSRTYAEAKAKLNLRLTKDDVLKIAGGQIKNENEQAERANKLLICDTDLLETIVYSKHYYDGFCPQSLKEFAYSNKYNLYFLGDVDTKWEADGIRDEPFYREEMFKKFEDALNRAKKPYVILKGTFENRFETCKEHIDDLIKNNK